jgi:3-hydroxyacyl-CoA dehydrogenase/3a,7a,12a-trihydroxy-5b-cholest-24-enoyl-CoA hydratase
VAYLAHPSCEESGSFFEASAGSFRKLRWERTEGLNLFPEETPVTVDTIASHWGKITDFAQAEHPTSMSDSLQRMYARFNR